MQTVEAGVQEFVSFDPDCVIALGGGSPIDAAKAIIHFSYKLYESLNIKKEVFIAVPTTSGTGSEVTSYSVITAGDRKIALAEDNMAPDVCITEY